MSDDVWVRLSADEAARLPWINIDPGRAEQVADEDD